jgi:hypothetical protein
MCLFKKTRMPQFSFLRDQSLPSSQLDNLALLKRDQTCHNENTGREF